jgi:putative FmdB family regulatory protein
MPFYDYQCESCGVFEEMRNLADRDRSAHCGACGRQAERVLTTASLLLPSVSESPRTTGESGGYGMRHRFGCACC